MKHDPVEIISIAIPVLIEATAVVMFVAMIAVWLVIGAT